MIETHVVFTSDRLVLEGLLYRQTGSKGVIVTHPHSLYGGDMYNPVVEAICRTYFRKGYSTLRFNFRGVGNSQGVFDNGCGEGKDVLEAVQYLLDTGLESIHVSGYSFGTRVLAGIDFSPQVDSQVYVSPPVAFMDFSSVGKIQGLNSVITGDKDDVAPPAEIRAMISSWNPAAQMYVLKNCDHFFSSSLDELESILADLIV